MARLLKAIENPYTTILGHMTGRLLLSRNGYPVDHKKIIDACAANQVVIELNAHPRRLDIDWHWIEYAWKKVYLFQSIRMRICWKDLMILNMECWLRKKAGLTKESNLSSYTLKQFEEFF